MSDYLWDRTGKPDPEIERLENLLARYRHSGAAVKTRRISRYRPLAALAIAASLAIMISSVVRAPRKSVWQYTLGDGGLRPAREGQTIDTGSATAKLQADSVGEVELEPYSRLQVLRSNDQQQRLALRNGTMHAFIWAPPRQFVVDTPSAATVDLGCQYTLQVLRDGSGLLRVSLGWVAFQTGAIESFIPAGAACRTRRQRGPGLPYFEDASEVFRQAVNQFEETDGREGLGDVLTAARVTDALTLWHLIVRTRAGDRDRVIDKFAQLAPSVDTAGLQRGDFQALDGAWNALGFGDTEWWRTWKQKW